MEKRYLKEKKERTDLSGENEQTGNNMCFQ